jgi:homoserine kinase type II
MVSCERIVISDRNALAWVMTSSERLLMKWSVAPDRFSRLSQIAQLTGWLHRQGLPASAPLPSEEGSLQVEIGAASICLQRVVQGDLLEVQDLEQVQAAGVVLARLHHALADYPGTDQIVPPGGQTKSLTTRVTDWLGSAGGHVPRAGSNTLRQLVDGTPTDLPPTQLIHGDFRSSNILCTGVEIAAVIDLEEARLDHCRLFTIEGVVGV